MHTGHVFVVLHLQPDPTEYSPAPEPLIVTFDSISEYEQIYHEACRCYLDNSGSNIVSAIKYIRSQTGLGLREAKWIAEYFFR